MVFEGFGDVGSVAYAEFERNVLEVIVDGTDGKREVPGNRFAGVSRGGLRAISCSRLVSRLEGVPRADRSGGVDSGAVESQAVGKGVQVGQIGGPDGGDPFGESDGVAGGGGEQCGELPDKAGEFGRLGAGGGEFSQEFVSLFRRLSGRVSRRRAKRRGVMTGRSPSARPWVM